MVLFGDFPHNEFVHEIMVGDLFFPNRRVVLQCTVHASSFQKHLTGIASMEHRVTLKVEMRHIPLT
jgi:hypothetical protein